MFYKDHWRFDLGDVVDQLAASCGSRPEATAYTAHRNPRQKTVHDPHALHPVSSDLGPIILQRA